MFFLFLYTDRIAVDIFGLCSNKEMPNVGDGIVGFEPKTLFISIY
jgi:hypothetical protein